MRRASVAAAGFALDAGTAVDFGGIVAISPSTDRFGRLLLACVEPLDLSLRGRELAAVALQAIRQTFAATPGAPAEALLAAFSAANAAVIAENRPYANGRWERRICVGATAVALGGRRVAVAQAAPTQAILVQDGQVYAFPDVASWRGDFIAESPTTQNHPLGLTEEPTPRLFFSEAATGDLIALCSTSVGRTLGRDEDGAVELYGGNLLTADLEGSVDRVERLLARHGIVDGFAVVASISRLPRQRRLWPGGPQFRPSVDRGTRPSHGSVTPRAVPVTGYAHPWKSASMVVMPAALEEVRPPVREGLRSVAIKIAEGMTPSRRTPAPTFDARQRAIAAPGALSVSRYRESSGLPAEWRANLPRGPGIHLPTRVLAVSCALFLTLGGTGFAVNHQRDRETRAALALVAADTALLGALEIPGSATTLVSEAATAVAAARESGASGEALASREQELARVRDLVWGVQRLSNVTRLGVLPGEPGSNPARLALSGSTVYLVAGNLYELAPEGTTLTTLLEEGDEVNGGVAGALRDVSVDGGIVVVSDGEATYLRDEQGLWRRRELAVSDVDGLHESIPVVSWGEAIYGFSWDGNIVRFEETATGPLTRVWAAVEDNPDLVTARDLAIDGRIHVLLEDGRLLTFSRGALTGSLSPFVTPVLNKAAFLAQAPFATDFYIVDPESAVGANVGRLVRVDGAGNARQFLTPLESTDALDQIAMATALSAAQDMVIDETNGTVYWVSGREIWKASLPIP